MRVSLSRALALSLALAHSRISLTLHDWAAVVGSAAAAGYLLARSMDDRDESDGEEEDEHTRAATGSMLRRNSALTELTKTGSAQKLKKLESAIFSQYQEGVMI